MKKIIFTYFVLLPALLLSQNDIEINKEFSLFTSKNAAGYFKPLFTTFGESLNTGLHTTAFYSNGWSLSLDISAMGMFIPESQKNFDAELPDLYGYDDITKTAELRDGKFNTSLSGFTRQPTIYGGKSNPVFAAPQNHFPPDSFYKTVAYAEGNNISFMPGLPVFQLVAGFPTRTQLRLRFLTATLLNEPLTYYTVALNQNIDKFFELFPEEYNMSLAANFAYHSISRDPGIDISSLAAGVHFSKAFDFGLSLYTGFQYEGFNGSFYAVKEDYNENDILNSPYEEVRNGDPLSFDIESFTNFRLLGGVSYNIGAFDFYADAGYASQPVIRAGMTIWFIKNKDKEKFKLPDRMPMMPDKSAPDLYAGRIQTEQKIFKADYLKVPEKKIIPPLLNANTEVFAMEDSIRKPFTKLKMEEFEIHELRALLPFVFFDENSSVLPEKYHLLSKENTQYFSNDSLLGKTTLDNYYHILNIIGKRMKQYETANITLAGYNSNTDEEKNNKELSQNRAEAVRDYLVLNWEIDTSRITIETGNLPKNPSNPTKEEGIVENRRVEISADLWEITAPIIIEDTLRKIQPEKIVFDNEAESEAGLKSWELSVYDSGDKLRSYKGSYNLDKEIIWEIDNDNKLKHSLRNNFDYTLEVTDTTSQFYTTQIKSIPVEFSSLEDKRKEQNQDTIYQKYNLILFEFNSAEIGPDNQRIVEIIKKRLKTNSEVTVNGYTDIIGDEEYNKNLSKRRAQSSANAINHSNSKVIGHGESKLIYPNDTPEGRFYSRTVVVDVKTPVNEQK
jgi:outer membrane protein OmpA-like peptidoglycan-associated protein